MVVRVVVVAPLCYVIKICRVASCRTMSRPSRRVASRLITSSVLVSYYACRVVTFCSVVLPRVTSRVMSRHGEVWQVYDPRTLRGVKAEQNRGAKGRAWLLRVPLSYRFIILETSAASSPGYYLVIYIYICRYDTHETMALSRVIYLALG